MISEPVDGSQGHSAELPGELAAALQSAFSRNLGSFDSLRITLRRYVQSQRKRGASLPEIDRQMRKLVAGVDAAPDGDAGDVTSELEAQIAKWTRDFFAGTQS